MPLKDNPDYENEEGRLKYTIEYLYSYYNRIASKKKRLDNELESNTKHYNSDNSQQYIDLIIGTTLKSGVDKKVSDIEKIKNKPYFARVDFTEQGAREMEKLYIGKMSLIREEDNSFIIIDWRAPISNLYYEGRLGKASYICPDGQIKGEIKLKRQFTIEGGKLQDFFDIDITTNDDFLQACLGANADNRLKDIVSTIQAEQNRVIRANMWRPLIVQGAAGGGKTTIALHRIAYLIYTYEKTMKPENFMIIAPSRFFLSYISEVLPELGVERVRQTTFEDFAREVIGKKLDIEDPNKRLAAIIDSGHYENADCGNLKEIPQFKSSLEFKDIVEEYLKEVEKTFIPQIDFSIDTYVIFTYDEIQKLFMEEYHDLPMMKRIAEIKKHLKNKLQREKSSILNDIEKYWDRNIESIKESMGDSIDRRKLIIDAAKKRDAALERVKKKSQSLLKEYIAKIIPLTPIEYYKELIKEKLNYKHMNFSPTGKLEMEDLAPIMYIKVLVYGLDEKIDVRHIIIDEAQDFSLFQLYVLKAITKNCSFTILGDLCQGIHSYRGITDWKDVERQIFKGECNFLSLKRSYRTTVEIMEAANKLIKTLKDDRLPEAVPVLRHGKPVKISTKDSLGEVAESISEEIQKVHSEGFKSAAIICKDMAECMKLKEELKKRKQSLKVITGNEKNFKDETIIIPSYLVKGLEFDVVFVANASRKAYSQDELDEKLLYVAMTRPLHRLYIYSVGEPNEGLKLTCS